MIIYYPLDCNLYEMAERYRFQECNAYFGIYLQGRLIIPYYAEKDGISAILSMYIV